MVENLLEKEALLAKIAAIPSNTITVVAPTARPYVSQSLLEA